MAQTSVRPRAATPRCDALDRGYRGSSSDSTRSVGERGPGPRDTALPERRAVSLRNRCSWSRCSYRRTFEPLRMFTLDPVTQTEAEKTSPFLVYLDVPPVTEPCGDFFRAAASDMPCPPTVSVRLADDRGLLARCPGQGPTGGQLRRGPADRLVGCDEAGVHLLTVTVPVVVPVSAVHVTDDFAAAPAGAALPTTRRVAGVASATTAVTDMTESTHND